MHLCMDGNKAEREKGRERDKQTDRQTEIETGRGKERDRERLKVQNLDVLRVEQQRLLGDLIKGLELSW